MDKPLYEADIPTAVSLLFAMIHYTEERKLFADIPGVRQWWHDTIRTDLLQDRNQTYLKVMEKGNMIAFAKWDFSKPDEIVARFLPWPPEINSEACEQLMTHIHIWERKRVMGSRRHYYLDMLAIHPAYQGIEASSTLPRWACRQADCDSSDV
ncbi:hypothetical protein VI817_010449 [Penicillium citrinum]|nr:hypothetical protein VI817_010449 [Penicillium citrinum]